MKGAAAFLGRVLAALFIFPIMSFSYNGCNGSQDNVDFVRLLISDTQSTNHVFEDSEILAFYTINAAQFQSGMFYNAPAGANVLASPVSYLRVAALALDSIAADKSRLASIKKLPDVQLDSSDAAIQMRATADQYRKTDDESGAFAIIEQVNDQFTFVERWWKTVMRANAQ